MEQYYDLHYNADFVLFFQVMAKYDSGAEYEVRQWIKQLTGEDIGSGAVEVEKKLRNGQILCR